MVRGDQAQQSTCKASRLWPVHSVDGRTVDVTADVSYARAGWIMDGRGGDVKKVWEANGSWVTATAGKTCAVVQPHGTDCSRKRAVMMLGPCSSLKFLLW